jgi:hypothetical protein
MAARSPSVRRARPAVALAVTASRSPAAVPRYPLHGVESGPPRRRQQRESCPRP